MAACLGEVRKKVSETVTRLMKDIPDIRIGIIAHGDYCDDVTSSRTISKLDFCNSSEVKKICKFVETVSSTGGGDSPEAYELALQVARKEFKWTEGYSKALCVIGDDVPHPPSHTTKSINWWDEVDKLSEMGVKIYGIRALSNNSAIPFYEEMSNRTGAVSIHFNNFKLIVDMFLAICYRESSKEKLEKFENEVKKDGKMDKELGQIFETLAKPNPIKKNTSNLDNDKIGNTQSWYNLKLDNEKPSYTLNNKSVWVPVSSSDSSSSSLFALEDKMKPSKIKNSDEKKIIILIWIL